MTIALMSRGYLCRPYAFLPRLDPPVVLDVEETKPVVAEAKSRRPPAPVLRKASKTEPTIRGAVESAQTAGAPAPSLTKAKKTSPTIRKVKKD